MFEREGQQLGSYKLIRFLGDGSFADVYLGEHIYLKIPIAVKVLRTRLSTDDVEGFFIEARTIASLEHPNIVKVLDCGVDRGVPFLVMNYASNGTLRQRHPHHTVLPPTVVLSYVKQAASGLQYAHDRKLIHRDIKPQNMLLGPKGELWLSDFGLVMVAHDTISQITQNNPAGTPNYMAPELFSGKPRPASDQYALAVVVYEWLCGERPFRGTYFELFKQHTSVPPPSLREKVSAISPAVEEVVLKALAKDPHQRFVSVQAFADALEEAYRSQPYLLPVSDVDLLGQSSQKELLPSMGQPGSYFDDVNTDAPTFLSPIVPFLLVQNDITMVSAKSSLASEDERTAGLSSPSAPMRMFREPDTPLPPIVPMTPMPPVLEEAQILPKKGISRRAVLVGLGVTIVLVSGATATILAWKNAPYDKGSTAIPTSGTKVHSHTATATPTPVGVPILIYPGQKDGIRTAVWSPDGRRIASGGVDKTVHIWNATIGNDLLKPPYGRHTRGLNSVAWSPHGEYIASGGEDQTVHVWNAASGKDLLFSPYSQHSKTVRSVAWSPNGNLIASGSEDQTVHVWDASTGNDVSFSPYTHHIGKVITVAWSPDGTRIASTSLDGTVRVWSSTTGQDVLVLTPPFHHYGERALAWSPPDGKYIVSGGDDKSVYLWDAATGQLIFTFSGHTDSVQSVAWSPDGQYIASGSFDTTVKIWSVAKKQLMLTYRHHTNQIWSVAWSLDGRFIASASIDGTVQIWKPL